MIEPPLPTPTPPKPTPLIPDAVVPDPLVSDPLVSDPLVSDPLAPADRLLRRWLAVLPAGTPEVAAVEAGQELITRWSQRHRHHHSGEHLTAMLDLIDAEADAVSSPAVVGLAAWFHDAVQEPGAADNEQRSAALAETMLRDLGLDQRHIDEVCRLVQLTATHDPDDGDAHGALLVDADLAILASEPARYDRYATDIRAEYRHLDERTFTAGRIAVLRRLMAAPALYRLVADRDAMQVRARQNLRRELDRLTAT